MIAPERTAAVIRVGKGGRGFIVDANPRRYVVTAAHCLPKYPEEWTFKWFLGTLGQRPTVWTTCVFVDWVADIAVLGGPDSGVLPDEYDAYVALTDPVVPFTIGGLKFVQQKRQRRLPSWQVIRGLRQAKAKGQMLSLDGHGLVAR